MPSFFHHFLKVLAALKKRGVRALKLLTNVSVVQVLTETSKEKLKKTFASRKLQLEKEIGQLQFERKRLEKKKKYPEYRLHEYFDREINRRKEQIELLDFQLEQLDILPPGSEIKERDMQAIVDIEVGDHWEDVLKGATIVVKDGIIAEIREV